MPIDDEGGRGGGDHEEIIGPIVQRETEVGHKKADDFLAIREGELLNQDRVSGNLLGKDIDENICDLNAELIDGGVKGDRGSAAHRDIWNIERDHSSEASGDAIAAEDEFTARKSDAHEIRGAIAEAE